MKILYVATHGRGLNDDEGAIAHALRALGHEVVCVGEGEGVRNRLPGITADFLLCHHWSDLDTLHAIPIPKVFWYFDRIDMGKPAFLPRTVSRRKHVAALTAACDLGFLTDGDQVAADTSGKLHWLPQGADGRIAGRGTASESWDILYVGNRRGREDFLAEMRGRWGRRFHWIPEGCYREQLRDAVASAKVVVAPDWPVSDRYWSNRVYVMLGFGAFLMHPYCATLQQHYQDRDHLVYYHSRTHLHDLINSYLTFPDARQALSSAALDHTISAHTYTQRCRDLVRIVRERLPL